MHFFISWTKYLYTNLKAKSYSLNLNVGDFLQSIWTTFGITKHHATDMRISNQIFNNLTLPNLIGSFDLNFIAWLLGDKFSIGKDRMTSPSVWCLLTKMTPKISAPIANIFNILAYARV